MTKAKLVRTSDGRVATLGELPPDSIIAGLSPATRSELATRLGAQPKARGPGRAAGNLTDPSDIVGRIKAVAASDEAKANPAAALALLADDEYRGISARGLIGAIGLAGPAASADTGDAIGRQMLAAMIAAPDPYASDASPAAGDPHGWAAVHDGIAAAREGAGA